MGQETSKKQAGACKNQTGFFSMGMLGLGVMGLMAFSMPGQANAAALCDAYAVTLPAAKSFFEKRCNVKFTPSKGHYCNKTSAGKYKCSNGGDEVVASKPVNNTPAVAGGGACKTVWAPTETSLAAANWSSGTKAGGKSRVSYDSKTDSVKISQLPNLTSMQLSDYRASNVVATGNVVRMTTQVYISPGFEGQAGARLGIGFRGGPTPQSAAGAGEGGSAQDGWSVRINHSAKVQPVLYSYHLNRNDKWGSGPRMAKGLPKGEWMTVVLEAKLNTPGVANGTAFLKVYDSKGKLFDQVSLNKALWRKNASWKYIGVYLTDKIPNTPKKQQYILYRNYKMFVGNGSSC